MTQAFAKFVEPARARPQLWRLLVGILLTVVVYAAVALAVLAVGRVFFEGQSGLSFWVYVVTLGTMPLTLLTLLASFAGLLLGTIAAARLLHRRSAATLFGRAPRVLRDFAIAAATAGMLIGSVFAVAMLLSDLEPNLAPAEWLRFLPAALLGILLQTGAEEAFFRGYLTQQLAARFASPLLWAVLPAALFGLAHVDTATYGADAWLIGLATGTFGLVAADLTCRSGSIGAAWGLHFANNCLVILVMSSEPRLNGLALYRSAVPSSATEGFGLLIAIDIATTLIAWLAIRRLVSLR